MMRFHIIDDLRALAVINMVLYHGMFDIVFLFGVNIPWFTGPIGFIWEQYICWSFILISGFCQAFAKKGLKEGLIVSFWGIVLTIILLIIPLGIRIYFGVLTFLGCAILATVALKKYLKRINPILGLVLMFSLFLIFRNINTGYLGFGSVKLAKIPETFYPVRAGWIQTWLGLTALDFSSADYFSFIPWFFLFLTGFYIYLTFKKFNKLSLFIGKPIPILTWISRHALIIYLLHQPIVYAILYVYFILK